MARNEMTTPDRGFNVSHVTAFGWQWDEENNTTYQISGFRGVPGTPLFGFRQTTPPGPWVTTRMDEIWNVDGTWKDFVAMVTEFQAGKKSH